MSGESTKSPVVHFVGSIPLPDSATVFRTLSGACGGHVLRLPDGETGIRKTWIKFLQDVLAENPAIEIAHDLPPFQFKQWDGKVVREIPRLRIKPGMTPNRKDFKTGYADMAIASFAVFDRMQKDGVIPEGVKFQVSIPTPIAPTYNNMVPADRPKLLPALTQHFIGEVHAIAAALPNDRIAIQWDVCQEVLAFENYFKDRPAHYKKQIFDMLGRLGDAVPEGVEMGYHLCYGSPRDEHLVQPKDSAILVEMMNGIAATTRRRIDFLHIPVPRDRTDDAYYAPLKDFKRPTGTKLYLGLLHHDDAAGDARRIDVARRHAGDFGLSAECGWGRTEPGRLPGLLKGHRTAAEGL